MAIRGRLRLKGDVSRGLSWSALNAMTVRLGNVLLGMVLARLLAPDEFAVFAVGLAVQAILSTLGDLGLGMDLVRARDFAKRAPTVSTLSIMAGVPLALMMGLTAKPIAALMGAPDAASIIVVLSFTLLLTSAAVAPFAWLTRNLEQRKLFVCFLANFVVGTAVTLLLITVTEIGPLALAVGRLVGQSVSTVLIFVFAGMRPRFGFDRSIARSAFSFGIPIAGANFLSWALLNIDTVVVARTAGATALGFYVLAFSISTFPISTIAEAIRPVSAAAFSRTDPKGRQEGLLRAVSLAWTLAMLVSVLLAALAFPLVTLFYGEKWSASAAVLVGLALFGVTRVVFDLFATYLMAEGRSRPILAIQMLWFAALVPVVAVATQKWGITGAGWAHVVVAFGIVFPAYLIPLRRAGVSVRLILKAMRLPALAAFPAWWVSHTVSEAISSPVFSLLAGGLAGVAIYVPICLRMVRRSLLSPSATRSPAPEEALPVGRSNGVAQGNQGDMERAEAG